MAKLRSLAVIVLAIALSGAAYSAPGRGGGGGHGGGGGGAHFGGGGGAHFGGGGGAHFGGGGGAHFGGGGMRGGGGGAHFGGGMRGGGAHFGGGGIRHFGGGGVRHFGGGGVRHFSGGGGRHFSGRFTAPRSTAGAISRGGGRTTFSSNGSNRASGFNRNANLRSRAVHRALNSRAVAGALHNRAALRNPGTRAGIAAIAATAGWHSGGGWWRHGHGGFGWVGPLFWPFAYYDIYDYALWGYGYDPSFWDYGYSDIYAGLFAPYGYDDLTGYFPGNGGYGVSTQLTSRAAANPAPDQLTQMCGDDSRDIAGLPIDQIQQVIQPNDAQRAALDDLANASVKAAQIIKAACPTQIALTAPARLAAMQQRIEAMIAAVGTVQPPLDKFYGLLDDEQKSRLNALGQRSKSAAQNAGGSLAQSCGATQAGVTDWPATEIDARLHPTDAQRASLTALQNANAKAEEMLRNSCQADDALTPPARLAAVGKRLDVMLQAVKTVRAALDDFYGNLTDEQKAQFEAIGQSRVALSSQAAAPTHHRRRHHAGVGGIIRHFMAFGW